MAWLKAWHDIGAIEIDVFHERAAIVAVENDVLVLAGRAAAFDDDADRIRWTNGSVRYVRRDEERLALSHRWSTMRSPSRIRT